MFPQKMFPTDLVFYQVFRLTSICPEDSDLGASDRPAALDNIRPIKPEHQKTKGKGKGKGRGRGRGRGKSCKDQEESDGPKPKRRRTRKKKEDMEEDQVQKEGKGRKDEKPGKVSKTKGKKAENTKVAKERRWRDRHQVGR